MSQALVRSEYDNGPIDTWNYNPGENDESEAIRIEDYANTYIVPYFNGLKRKSGNYVQLENDHAIYYHLNDGSAFTIHEGGCADIRFDYNDEAGPNQLGRDRFAFLLCHSDDTRYFVLSDTPGISPYCPRSICGTRQSALATCKNDGRYCSGVLQYDGWEFKDDYPYKL